jgi:spermidine/putrescine transport system permease protein
MRFYALLVYLFLYIPIGIIVLFSFNAGRHASELQGFSVKWFGIALSNPFVMEALKTSLIISGIVAVLSSIMGTMAALGLQNLRGLPRMIFDSLIYIAIMIPGIVFGIATLVALATALDFINPLIKTLWPIVLGEAPRLKLGLISITGAHTLWTTALATVIIRARVQGMDRSLIDASIDLYATPWRTFRQVTLPQIFPGILAAALLNFTLSFDDFIIAFFVAGGRTTLPIYVFASIRRGITPEINAIATMMLIISLTLLFSSQVLLRKKR